MKSATSARTTSRYRSLENAESLRELVMQLKEGVYITDPDGRILDANPALVRMLGADSLDQLRSIAVFDLMVDPTECARERELLESARSVREFELRMRRLDGKLLTVIDTCHVCHDPATGEKFYRGVLVDITQRKELENRLIEQSIRDPLTGCFNRRYLPQFEQHAARVGWGCIAIDVDHFKDYNDRHGHKAGDKVLVSLSRLLIRHARAEEAVVRMGGDEFAVLLGGANPQATAATAKRLQAAGEAQSPVQFSLGWAARQGQEKLEKTLARADRAMFEVRVRHRGPEHDRRRR
jgi:diguanylate cyclase (GGDEF)-like protein/PAS domain S-box-containing protein